MGEERAPTSRGLVDFDVGPLRKFTGILDSMPREPQSFGEGVNIRNSMRVTYNFSSIEVLETIEPYHFPVFSCQATESNRKKSMYGVFAESFNAVADSQYTPEQLDPSNPAFVKAADRMDFTDIIGKNRIGVVLADGEDGRPEPPMLFDGRVGEDRPRVAWMVYMIEGVGVAGAQGMSAIEIAEALLHGKTLSAFNKDALANDAIKTNVALLQSISLPVSAPASFANVLVATGKFTKDAAGVYHKAEVAAPATT
jgi:hypothetical protein